MSAESEMADTADTCKNCGDPLNRNQRKYCSMECQHDYTYIEKTCPHCEETFETAQSVDKTYCSQECTFADDACVRTGEDNPFYEGRGEVEIECGGCGEPFTVPKCRTDKSEYTRKYCSRTCMGEAFSDGRLKKENHPRWDEGQVEKECIICGEGFWIKRSVDNRKETFGQFCSMDCRGDWMSENLVGEDAPAWKGGYDPYYGANWVRQRRKALERDNHVCVVCGRGEEELGREPDVHHIKPIRLFDCVEDANTLSNLITLCQVHHQKVEGWGIKPENVLQKG